VLKRAVRAVLRRQPRIRNALLRLGFPPFGHDRRPGLPDESADLVARTDDLNRAAEGYFTAYDNRPFLLGKPFSDDLFFPRHLFSLGLVLEAVRIRPSDVVVEFGAGTCWVSHFLNRYGCRTIAIDVSPTALEVGREVFRRDPATNWTLDPRFLTYDGHTLPLPDSCCDKVIVFDALHHVPNLREILTELRRILKPHGVVGLSEPGTGHAGTASSRRDVEKYGVLENELVVEDVAALAKACGFRAASLIVPSGGGVWEIPAEDLDPFMGGKGFVDYWEHLCRTLVTGHYLLLYKGDPTPTTRHPKFVNARIRVTASSCGETTAVGLPVSLTVEVTNTGDTRWLADEQADGGWTRLGAHLYRLDDVQAEATLVDFDWFRAGLPGDVASGETVTLTLDIGPIRTPGAYRVVLDMVIEGQAWFADRGSEVATVPLTIHE
jgi:SAM-dependent methyltransferase